MRLCNTNINVGEVSRKYAEWLVVIGGPETGCAVMTRCGKVVSMRGEPYIPHRECVTLERNQTCPSHQAP